MITFASSHLISTRLQKNASWWYGNRDSVPRSKNLIDTYMEKITFHYDKKEGKVRVRYRLRDGRKTQICHTSDIICDLKELGQFMPNGETVSRKKVYNIQLSESLKREYEVMKAAYAKMCDEGLDITTEVFEREITAIKTPIQAVRAEQPSIIQRFRKYADDAYRNGILGANRHKHIIVVSDKLERFLCIKGISAITAEEFTIDHLMEFREFIFNEYNYVTTYPKLYSKVLPQNKPSARLSMNTVTSQLKMFQTFFTELEDRDEINKSPFRKLGKTSKKTIMKTKYDNPVFLRKDEFQILLAAKNVPASLQDTLDAFLVQIAFGCRISDFQRMDMSKIAVSEEGIPYIHYIPKKTANAQEDNTELMTPILRFAFDIIQKTGFQFPILKNVSGAIGYNNRIKALLQHFKIDRMVEQYNEETKENEYVELYKVASSKLARKTHVDMMNKVQVDMYAAGLHKAGSSAVKHYTNLELKDHFTLMNAAFEQEPYHVNQSLEITP